MDPSPCPSDAPHSSGGGPGTLENAVHLVSLAQLLTGPDTGQGPLRWTTTTTHEPWSAWAAPSRPSTLATVAGVEPASQDVAGLVAELVSQPGIGTALAAVGDTAESTTELPGLTTGHAARASSAAHVAAASAAPCGTQAAWVSGGAQTVPFGSRRACMDHNNHCGAAGLGLRREHKYDGHRGALSGDPAQGLRLKHKQ